MSNSSSTIPRGFASSCIDDVQQQHNLSSSSSALLLPSGAASAAASAINANSFRMLNPSLAVSVGPTTCSSPSSFNRSPLQQHLHQQQHSSILPLMSSFSNSMPFSMGQPLSAIGGGGASSCGSLAYLQQHQYQLHQHQLRGG